MWLDTAIIVGLAFKFWYRIQSLLFFSSVIASSDIIIIVDIALESCCRTRLSLSLSFRKCVVIYWRFRRHRHWRTVKNGVDIVATARRASYSIPQLSSFSSLNRFSAHCSFRRYHRCIVSLEIVASGNIVLGVRRRHRCQCPIPSSPLNSASGLNWIEPDSATCLS